MEKRTKVLTLYHCIVCVSMNVTYKHCGEKKCEKKKINIEITMKKLLNYVYDNLFGLCAMGLPNESSNWKCSIQLEYALCMIHWPLLLSDSSKIIIIYLKSLIMMSHCFGVRVHILRLIINNKLMHIWNWFFQKISSKSCPIISNAISVYFQLI